MDCRYCQDTGQISACLISDPIQWYCFRCFCDKGEQYNPEHFIKWGSRFEYKYIPEYRERLGGKKLAGV